MKRPLKEIVKRRLKDLGLRVEYYRKETLSGRDFVDDIRVLVVCDKPVIFDIGANQGQTIEMFCKAFRQPEIYAFEPSAACYASIAGRYNCEHIHTYNMAIGNEISEKMFINYEDPCLSSFRALSRNNDNPFREVKIRNTENVQLRTLDWFVEQNRIAQIDLLKSDTQGYDLEVLKGAQTCFQRRLISHVFVELNFRTLYSGQDNTMEIFALLLGNGFRLVDFYDKVYENNVLGWCNGLFSKV